MFLRNFHPDQFLRKVAGTEPFRDYCGQRGILWETPSAHMPPEETYRRSLAALAKLPHDKQVQVEADLAKVNELGDRDAIALLLKAAEGKELPSDLIPSDAAVALYFFMRHPDLFHEVFLHYQARDNDGWRNAQAPSGLMLNYLDAKAQALAASLQEFFQAREGVGRFSTVTAYQLQYAFCFVAHVSDRLHVVEGFTDNGELVMQRFWPALPLLFAYYPQDGTLAMKSPLEPADWVWDLLQRFGKVVLGVELQPEARGYSFALDLLKRRFDPAPDAMDMELVRVKTLHLAYPERQGRRQVRLETLATDEQFAVLQMVQTHLSGTGIFDQLRVVYAEIQVRMRFEGRSKSYLIRLWPNRCNIGQTALGERLRACLKRWGVYHGS